MLKTFASRQTRERTLRAGVYTFGNNVTRVYPGHQEAGADFNAALSAVGARPTGPLDGETGIQPIVGRLSDDPRGNGNANFDTAMATLARDYLTASPGDGKTAAAPRKVLVLITDGFDDASTPTRFSRAAFNPESCDGFKRRGYEVIVLDVPYYPIMHIAYLAHWVPIVETTGPASLIYNLRACASKPADFITVNDTEGINRALVSYTR